MGEVDFIKLMVITVPFVFVFIAAGYLYCKLGHIKPKENKK